MSWIKSNMNDIVGVLTTCLAALVMISILIYGLKCTDNNQHTIHANNHRDSANYGSRAMIFTIAITDSGFFFPNTNVGDTVPRDGYGIMYPGKLPQYIRHGRYLIKLSQELDTGCYHNNHHISISSLESSH